MSRNHKQSNDFPHFRCWCESMHRLQRFEPRCSRMQNSPTIFISSSIQISRLQHQNAHVTIDAQAAGILIRRLSFIHPVQGICSDRPHIGYWIPRQIQIRICSDGSASFTLCYDGAPLRSWILDAETDTDTDATALCWHVVLSAV